LKGYNLFQKKILHRGGICYLNIGTDFHCQESGGRERDFTSRNYLIG
jgi:hypothetical protein